MTQLLHVAAACAVLAGPADKDADAVRVRNDWHACVREKAASVPIESAIQQCAGYERTVVQVYHLLGVRPSQIREMTSDSKAYLRCEISKP